MSFIEYNNLSCLPVTYMLYNYLYCDMTRTMYIIKLKSVRTPVKLCDNIYFVQRYITQENLILSFCWVFLHAKHFSKICVQINYLTGNFIPNKMLLSCFKSSYPPHLEKYDAGFDLQYLHYSREAMHRFRTSNNAKSNPEIKGRNSIF
jgi:hypothetical protein